MPNQEVARKCKVTMANQEPKEKRKRHISRKMVQCKGESCVLLERLKLALFWFCLPLLHCLTLEVKSHRQMVHIKYDVKQKGQTKNPVQVVRVKKSFLKIFTLEEVSQSSSSHDLKIRLHVEKSPSRIKKLC